MNFRFEHPVILLFLILIPLLLWRYIRIGNRHEGSLKFSSVSLLQKMTPSFFARHRYIPFALRMVILILLILAFARPQAGIEEEEVIGEGVDIVVVVDNSGSMRAEDFKPKNRLAAAKDVVQKFVDGRKHDRIGLVVFAAKSYMKCPLTIDYMVLKDFISRIDFTPQEDDGTAIGMGVGTAVKRIKDSHAKNKVIILLTDGRNNRGQIDPMTAAELAQQSSIKIYTIGVGTEGEAPFPVKDALFGKRYIMLPEELQEDVLIEMADKTGGQYFRATDKNTLSEIFSTIDAMEKTQFKIKVHTSYRELFRFFFYPACIIFLMELGLLFGKYHGIP